MPLLRDESGKGAVVGQSHGYWLNDTDFVSTAGLEARNLGKIGFPRDWPAVYSQNKTFKSLVGKKGICAGKKVGVVGCPSDEDRSHVLGVPFEPLQSFTNAERASKVDGMSIIHGWLVLEHLDMPVGAAFVAERYWWNALPDGKWVDFTPRPKAWSELILAEAAAGASKTRSLLTCEDAELTVQLLRHRFNILVELQPSQVAAAAVGATLNRPTSTLPLSAAKLTANQVAAPIDYSKWACIVDSDEEDDTATVEAARLRQQEPCGIKDLAETHLGKRKPLPVPDYLVGNTGGGGGTNCFTSICRLLDKEKDEGTINTHQLVQAFSKVFHCGLSDWRRQRFYERALATVSQDAFIVVCGLGSIVPLLRVARRVKCSGVLLESCKKLCSLTTDLLKANNLSLPCKHVVGGLDRQDEVEKALKQVIPHGVKEVVVLTEQFAHDMLSCGVVANMQAVHKAVLSCVPGTKVSHIPQTIELSATPLEVRSERIAGFDIRAFNMLRHTTSNEKADFWWFPVRLDNQPEVKVAALGPPQTLCGFDFNRAAEISLDEARRTIKLPIEKRGRCNAAGLWWTMRFSGERYSTEPDFVARERGEIEEDGKPNRSEWKQAVHYLAGETAVFPRDTLELLVSITPRFTIRALQQSPFSVETPPWIKAPAVVGAGATLPVLPYHFLMMTDTKRLQVYKDAIQAAVQAKKKELGRRPRVLDAGCGIGLLGMIAACEGAEVWLCEAMPMLRRMSREVLASNVQTIADNRGLVNILPEMMSTRIQVGPDGEVQEKFDIVVSEVMDLWCLGEGVIPTMRHARAKLLADGGLLLPQRLVVFAQPIELGVFSQPEKVHKVNLSPMYTHFKAKYSPLRIQQMGHRFLSDEPMPALEIDLNNVPEQPAQGEPNLEGLDLCIRMGGKPALQAKLSTTNIDRSGMLSGYGVWWSADLGNGCICSNAPSDSQRSWKQLVRWLDEPRFVNEGEEVQVLGCHNDNQVNIEDVHIPAGAVQQFKAQLQTEQGQQNATLAAVQAAQAIRIGSDTRQPAPKSELATPSSSKKHLPAELPEESVIEVD